MTTREENHLTFWKAAAVSAWLSILILAVVIILTLANTKAIGAEPPQFTVVNKTAPTPMFTVVNKTTPDDGYTGPAPAGQHWERRQGEKWKLVPDATVPVVTARPFQAGRTTAGTIAQPVVVHNTSFQGSTVTERTTIRALTTAPYGVINGSTTNCPPSG